jgi:hypothetical protein
LEMIAVCPGHGRCYINILWIEILWAWCKSLVKNLLQQIKNHRKILEESDLKKKYLLVQVFHSFDLEATLCKLLSIEFCYISNVYWIPVDLQISMTPWSYQL